MQSYEEEIKAVLKEKTGLKEIILEIPKNPDLGDYAFPCYMLAKEMKKMPDEIAKSLAEKINPVGGITAVNALGPYLNFRVNRQDFIKEVLKKILAEKDSYGSLFIGRGK